MEKNRETTESLELDNNSSDSVNVDLLQNEEIKNAENIELKNAVDKNQTSNSTDDTEVDPSKGSVSPNPIDESNSKAQDEKKSIIDAAKEDEADKGSRSEKASPEKLLQEAKEPDLTLDKN
ncbi:MAG: hypothetical protein V3U58_07285, partial [Thermodesulfobacteriota bacterium]